MILYALLQICSQQQRISFAQYLPHAPQENFSCVAIEIPDGAPEKEHQQMVAFGASFGHGAQAFQIWLFMPDNTYQIDLPQFLLASRQRRR